MRRVVIVLVSAAASLVVTALLYWLAAGSGGSIDFEDPGLEAAVREAIEYRGGAIPRNELERLTELDASDRGIESLAGIEAMPNLSILDLTGNRIQDLSLLTELVRLRELHLRDNNMVDLRGAGIEALGELPELELLNLRHNRGVSHPESPDEHQRISDLSPLLELSGLVKLDLRDNHVEDVGALAELGSLRHLDLRDNRLSENAVAPLSALSQLEHLNLRNNDLRSIEGIGSLTSLRYLNLHSNEHIESILPIAPLTLLDTLILRRVPVEQDISVLAELTALSRVNLRQSGIRELGVLADLMEQGALQDDPQSGRFAEVDIRENPISDGPEGDQAYRVLDEFWPNIGRRHPQELPE